MFHRSECYECGHKESYWSAFKRWLREKRHPQPVSPYQKYFQKAMLNNYVSIIDLMIDPKPFPENMGASTIRFREDKGSNEH